MGVPPGRAAPTNGRNQARNGVPDAFRNRSSASMSLSLIFAAQCGPASAPVTFFLFCASLIRLQARLPPRGIHDREGLSALQTNGMLLFVAEEPNAII